MEVMIDGVEYVPKVDILPINDAKIKECLEVLTEMMYFNQKHKMRTLAWNALYALAPNLAGLSHEEAFNRVRDD